MKLFVFGLGYSARAAVARLRPRSPIRLGHHPRRRRILPSIDAARRHAPPLRRRTNAPLPLAGGAGWAAPSSPTSRSRTPPTSSSPSRPTPPATPSSRASATTSPPRRSRSIVYLSTDRRLWRPRRRLGRRDDAMPPRLGPLPPARRGGECLARLRRRDRRAARHHPPRRHLRARPRAVREDPPRHRPPHRQAGPGVQPHPCRRHRGDRRSRLRAARERHLQRHRRRARPAGRGSGARRKAPRPPAAAGGDLRRRRHDADGPQLLRREQARPEREDQSRTLGVRLAHPTYREGLAAILALTPSG